VFLESLVPTLLIHVSVRGSIPSARSLYSGTTAGTDLQIEQIPYQKRPYPLHPVRITVTRFSAIIADQS
jgi:hypothetical protein